MRWRGCLWSWGGGWLAVASLCCGPGAVTAGEFQFARQPTDAPLESVRVTITVGEGGAPLAEPVDLHLGLGFPLRLYPLGTDAREPAFAAFPDSTSLAADARHVDPGKSASFEFRLTPAEAGGADPLQSAPELLRDLRFRDVQRVGFASLGTTDWVLDGYAIEINGQPFVSHAGLDLRAQAVQRGHQAELQTLVAAYEGLMRRAAALYALTTALLATPEERAEFDDLLPKLTAQADAINALAARVSGALPWYVETHEDFRPAPIQGRPIGALEVTLLPRDGEATGSLNPVYFWADGRKYQLTSEADPLASGRVPQTFWISKADLEASPLVRRRFDAVGVGMLGHDRPDATGPDRAELERVVVRADGELVYDSALVPADGDALGAVALAPPAFRDAEGQVTPVEPQAGQTTLWKSSGLLPEGTDADAAPPVGPELAADDAPTFQPAGPNLLLVPYAPGGLNAPRRRRPRTLRPIINVLLPAAATAPSAAAGGPAGPRRPRPVTPRPAPAAPVLGNIRVNPLVPILRDGDQATVYWQVSGDTSNVTSYRVDLFGVLPHKNPPLINTPLATQTGITPAQSSGSGGSQTLLAQPPAIAVSKIQSQLTGAEAQYLWVQPKVTALGKNGRALVSGFGSLLPLFPAAATSPHAAAMLPGEVFTPQGVFVAAQTPPPSFQVLPAGAPPLPWRSSPANDPQSQTTAWPVTNEQDSSFALTFAAYGRPAGALALPAYNAAVRPASNGERIVIQYEAAVPIPNTLPTPAKGWRLVAHVGYLGGTAPSTAFVQSRVNVQFRPAATAPFFTMQTPAPIRYSKFSSGPTPGPCLLIDMPIRFDLMAANNLAASPHDASKYAITTFDRRSSTGYNWLGRTAAGPVANIVCTFMIGQQTTDATDAIGVFGVRLVPDNN